MGKAGFFGSNLGRRGVELQLRLQTRQIKPHHRGAVAREAAREGDGKVVRPFSRGQIEWGVLPATQRDFLLRRDALDVQWNAAGLLAGEPHDQRAGHFRLDNRPAPLHFHNAVRRLVVGGEGRGGEEVHTAPKTRSRRACPARSTACR